jgi:PAS domain S-box-containing protein
MHEYKRLAFLILIMIGVAVVVGGTALGVFYDAAFERERQRLVIFADSQARLIESLEPAARFDVLEEQRFLREAAAGQTSELQLAHREGDRIVYVTPERGADRPHAPVTFGGPVGQPMTQALSGSSGTMIGIDYRGNRVLAAFKPLPGLGLGLVAKIDMAEINGRYLQAGLIAGLASLAAILGAAFLFFRVGEPMVRRLRESEQRYRNLVEAQPDPICQFLPDTTLTFVNRAYADFYGREPDELIGRRWLDFAPADERPRFLEELSSFTPENRERHEETRSTRVDHEVRWYLCHLYAFFDRTGNVASFQTFATDISERKQAEEALRRQVDLLAAITDSAADAIFVTDGEARLTLMNAAAERIFGWARLELIGRKLHDAIHDHHPDGRPYPAAECPLSRVYVTGETFLGHEDVFFRKDGTPVPVACSNAPLMVEGRIAGSVLVAHDITARKRTEAALRESEARYRTAGEAIRYGVWICNPEGGVEFVSQIFLDLIGKTLDEVRPRGWVDRLPPEDVEPALQAWRECVRTGSDWAWEHRVKGKDGVWHTVLSLGRPVRDAQDRITSWAGFNLDISDRKQAENALSESEARFRSTFDNAAVGVSHIGMDGRWLRVNQRLCEIVGYSRDELLQRNFQEITHPEDLPLTLSRFTDLHRGMIGTYHLEKRYVHKDGHPVWVELTSALQRNEAGDPVYSISIIQDISARKAAEHALRESEIRMRALLDASQDEILLVSTNGEVLASNKAAERRLAKRTGDASPVGARLEALLPPDQAEQRLRRIRQVASTATLIHWEAPIRSRWFEFWFYPVLRPNNLVSEVAVYAREITQQKKSQADLSKLFQAIQQSPTSVVITDRDGSIEYVNPKFCEVTGYTEEEAISQNPRVLKSGHTPQEVYTELWETISSGNVWRGELLNKKKNGELFWELASIAPVMQDDTIAYYVAVKEDITERKQIEDQLRQSQKMQALGHLTGGIAHDFNNLLGIVIGNLQLLNERVGGDARNREFLDDALWAARRGGELTHRLLAFARKQPLKPTIIDLNEVVRGITELFRRTLGMSIRIEEVLAPFLWKALADRGELERALVNLAVNSRDAMRGTGTLTLETRNALLDEDYAEQYEEVVAGEYVLLAVTDTGTGMPPEVAERVFEPFFTTKEVGQGSGLGLSMVYGFVKQSGGHVSVYSRLGQGTSVKLYLPRAPSSSAEPHEKTPNGYFQDMADKVVLVVEDESKLRRVAVKMLDRLGLQSLQAETAQDALELLADAHVDVLFTDIELAGGMNGTELAKAAHDLRPQLKVLYTTGFAREASLHERGLDERAPWLLKPYSHQELARELKALLVPQLLH